MVNLSQKIENKLLFGIRASVSNKVWGKVNNPMWRELYGKVLNQTGAMRNISTVVNNKLTKTQNDVYDSVRNNFDFMSRIKLKLKLTYLVNTSHQVITIGKEILHRICCKFYKSN
jgi:hypothetical protein